MLTIDEAIHKLRATPEYAQLVHDGYLGRDVLESGERFRQSAEFEAVKALLGTHLHDAVVVDVGAGTGIASYAFCKAGARQVYAVEPDPSDEVGRGAIARIKQDLPITIIDAFGDQIPLDSETADIVYMRQVLHHILDLPAATAEFTRLLKPGGILIACREHVVDDAQQLTEFLANHPVHRLAGGENAHSLETYCKAIEQAGLALLRCIEPWDSIINAFPTVRSETERTGYARARLRAKIGTLGTVLASVPGVEALVWQRIRRPVSGRMYSFLAVKAGG